MAAAAILPPCIQFHSTISRVIFVRQGCYRGVIFGRVGVADGSLFTTGAILASEPTAGLITDASGEAFLLGQRSRRRCRKNLGRVFSPLDAYAGRDLAVPYAPALVYRLGGADLSASVRAVMSASFATLDESAVELRGEYADARLAVLTDAGEVVAAAVVEMHVEAKCLQIPLLAAAKGRRQKGYGSVLFACLGELAEEVSELAAVWVASKVA